MTVKTFIRIYDPTGTALRLTVATGFVVDYIANCSPGAIGVMELTCPPGLDFSNITADCRMGAYVSIDGGPPYLDCNALYFIETIELTSAQVFLRGFHANTLTTRRYVLYPSGSTQADKAAAPADNQLKAYWKENAGSSIAGTREGVQTLADISSVVSVDANLSLGPSVAMSGAHDPLENVLQRICDASATAGTYLTYEIIALSPADLRFRTYVGARGVDRRYGTAAPVILSEQRRNLSGARLTIDYHNEVTAAIAGGQGQGADHLVASALDTTRMSISPVHRIERSTEMGNANNLTAVQDAADAILRENRPSVSVTGTLVDTPGCVRGIHYDLGDILSVAAPLTNQLIDVRLDLVHVHIDASGQDGGQDLTSHQVQHRYATGGLRSV